MGEAQKVAMVVGVNAALKGATVAVRRASERIILDVPPGAAPHCFHAAKARLDHASGPKASSSAAGLQCSMFVGGTALGLKLRRVSMDAWCTFFFPLFSFQLCL